MTEKVYVPIDEGELLKLLEENAHGDVSASIAISLRRIADKLAEEPAKAPPGILHR